MRALVSSMRRNRYQLANMKKTPARGWSGFSGSNMADRWWEHFEGDEPKKAIDTTTPTGRLMSKAA